MSRGFSLVEIAIVLVVVGLVISGGLLGLSPVLQANKLTQANQQMDKIEQALVLYVIQNGCLPCPASPSVLNGESHLATDYSSGCSGSGTICSLAQGIVPWVNLGLAKTDVIDPYGYFFDYAATTSATNTLSLTNLTTSMVRTLPSTYPAGALSVQDDSSAPVTQSTVGAYVLISHGPDGSGGYSPVNGVQHSDPNNSAAQACNIAGAGGTAPTCGTGLTAGYYVQDTPKGASYMHGYYDDILRFRTAPVIIQLCGSDACGNPA